MAVPKTEGEFLKPHNNQVQINCPFSPVSGFSHWKAKIGWLCGARQMQKNASLRSRQVKNFVSAGTRLESLVYGSGTIKYRVMVAEFTARGPELA
jgi:hypothetical protein